MTGQLAKMGERGGALWIVETRIGRALLTDAIPDGAAIRVELKGEELVVNHHDPQPSTSTAM